MHLIYHLINRIFHPLHFAVSFLSTHIKGKIVIWFNVVDPSLTLHTEPPDFKKSILDELEKEEAEEKAAKEAPIEIKPLDQNQYDDIQKELDQAERLREKKRMVAVKKEQRILEKAMAIRIQSVVRGNLPRERVGQIRAMNQQKEWEDMAAKLMNRTARGYLGRKKARRVKKYRIRNEQTENAALGIQKVFRGHVIRKQYYSTLQESKALILQRNIRGMLGRRKADCERGNLDSIRQRHH